MWLEGRSMKMKSWEVEGGKWKVECGSLKVEGGAEENVRCKVGV